jgi:hypothetical protein
MRVAVGDFYEGIADVGTGDGIRDRYVKRGILRPGFAAWQGLGVQAPTLAGSEQHSCECGRPFQHTLAPEKAERQANRDNLKVHPTQQV